MSTSAYLTPVVSTICEHPGTDELNRSLAMRRYVRLARAQAPAGTTPATTPPGTLTDVTASTLITWVARSQTASRVGAAGTTRGSRHDPNRPAEVPTRMARNGATMAG